MELNFFKNSSIKSHTFTHTEEKPFHFEICGAKFSCNTYLMTFVKFADLNFPKMPVSKHTCLNTQERNLFIVKSVELNFPRITVSKDTCQPTQERPLFVVISVELNFPTITVWKDMSTHTWENIFLMKSVLILLSRIHIFKNTSQRTLDRIHWWWNLSTRFLHYSHFKIHISAHQREQSFFNS